MACLRNMPQWLKLLGQGIKAFLHFSSWSNLFPRAIWSLHPLLSIFISSSELTLYKPWQQYIIKSSICPLTAWFATVFMILFSSSGHSIIGTVEVVTQRLQNVCPQLKEITGSFSKLLHKGQNKAFEGSITNFVSVFVFSIFSYICSFMYYHLKYYYICSVNFVLSIFLNWLVSIKDIVKWLTARSLLIIIPNDFRLQAM